MMTTVTHGDRHRMVPVTDAEAFHAALSRAGARSTLVTVAGAGRDDPVLDAEANIAITAALLRATLSPSAAPRDPAGRRPS